MGCVDGLVANAGATKSVSEWKASMMTIGNGL